MNSGSEPIPFPRRTRTTLSGALTRHVDPVAPMPPHNLPVLPTPFVGRHDIIDEICTLLLDESVRLLTLTGPGGVGKTRLALRVAEEVLPYFEDGVYFVALASIADPNLVVPTIAQALGVKEAGNSAISEVLRESLQDKGMLLVLDNLEQVVGAATQIREVLSNAPGVQVIITSRVSLHLYGEHEYPVPPMDMPGADESEPTTATSLSKFEAIQLFVARARAIDAEFRLTDSNAATIAEICRRLDGLPLALELAATRLRLFNPKALLSRLEKSLPLLTGGARDMPDRHRTLYNSIDWSYNLLSPAEKQLFTLMSVFVGGYTLSAVESLAATISADPNAGTLDQLDSLVAQSLVRRWQWQDSGEEAEREPRFWMLATIREFALEKLAEQQGTHAARTAHANYFLNVAEEARGYLRGPQQEVWFDKLERDHNNFRAALTFLFDGEDPMAGARLVSVLAWFWYVRGFYTEGRRWISLTLSAVEQNNHDTGNSETLALRADILRIAGILAYMQSDHDQAVDFSKQALKIARRLEDKGLIARTLNNIGTILDQQGKTRESHSYHEESLQIRREMGDRPGMAHVLANLALVRERQGDHEQASSMCEECITIAREMGDNTRLASYIYHRGKLAFRRGDLPRAEQALRESLALSREIKFKACELWCLSELGLVLCEKGDPAEANKVLEEGLELSRQAGDLTETSWVLLGQGVAALITHDYDRARATLQEAVQLRRQLREYNLSTIETLEWLATAEARIAVATDDRRQTSDDEPQAARQPLLATEQRKAHARRAVLLFGVSDARRKVVEAVTSPVWRPIHARSLGSAQEVLGKQAFSEAWTAGQTLAFEDACALAVQTIGEGQRTADDDSISTARRPLSVIPDDHELSVREIEVLRLITAGLTNKEIADRLIISPRTVQAHLYRIFSKLDVTTRTAASRFAIDRRLV